ncbi:MAG: helix-turn-helix domain-containing protein [Saprospiraceae bacterium]|nr:helix-turn-helix domain-containing protein [Saprospiraceae bacterium]
MKNKEHIKIHQLKNILGFELDSIGHVNAYNPMEKHRHDYWELFLFAEGNGTHLIDFAEYEFTSKSIHFIQPFQIHTLNRNSKSDGLVIMFHEHYFHTSPLNKQLFATFTSLKLRKLSPIVSLKESEFSQLWQLLQVLKEDLKSPNVFTKTIISNYLNIIFCQCIKHFGHISFASKNQYIEIYNAFISNLIQHNFENLSINDYAILISCSTKQLRNACEHCSGLTPSDIIHDFILQKAKQMLLFDKKTVKEVASELNFTDVAHFTNFFKKKTGILPSYYKD